MASQAGLRHQRRDLAPQPQAAAAQGRVGRECREQHSAAAERQAAPWQGWLLASAARAASVAAAASGKCGWCRRHSPILAQASRCMLCLLQGRDEGCRQTCRGSLRANSLAAGQSTQKRAQRLSLPPEQLLATQALWRTAPQAAAHQAASFRLRQKKAHRTGKELGRRPAQSTGLCRSQEVFASPRSAARQSGCLSTQNFHSRLHVKFWHGHPEPDITGRYVPQQSHRCCCQKTAAAAAGGSGL